MYSVTIHNDAGPLTLNDVTEENAQHALDLGLVAAEKAGLEVFTENYTITITKHD